MDFLSALIFGAVEGVSEFLPISSTGHLILTARLLGIPQTDFQKSFEIAIQLGAILSVIVLYAKRVQTDRRLIGLMIAGFVPTGAIGLLLHRIVKQYFLDSTPIVLWSLLLGGIALLLFEEWHSKAEKSYEDLSAMTYAQAFWIGCCQAVAIIPGVSRSAATIVGGMALGLRRTAAAEFSFLLAIPTMLAATGLDLLKSGGSFTFTEWQLLAIGFVTAFIVALLSVRWLLGFLQTGTFRPFAAYRILLAIVFWFWLAS